MVAAGFGFQSCRRCPFPEFTCMYYVHELQLTFEYLILNCSKVKVVNSLVDNPQCNSETNQRLFAD